MTIQELREAIKRYLKDYYESDLKAALKDADKIDLPQEYNEKKAEQIAITIWDSR